MSQRLEEPPSATPIPDKPESSAHPALATNLDRTTERTGVLYGLAAYLWWGVVPIYFKLLALVSPLEVLGHRVIWSVSFLGWLLHRKGKLGQTVEALRHRRTLITLICSTLLIAVNWFTFIYAVVNERLLEASLGYFINPLVNILLGYLFLRERLRPWQLVSVALAFAGVTYRTLALGTFPTVALILAFSFGLYGLLRKTARVEALVGLTVETAFLAPLGLIYVAYLTISGTGLFLTGNLQTTLLLPLAGLITALPLLWFTHAARRLRLSTVGFMQYIAPSMQFFLAAVVFGEPFTRMHGISFAFIWLALIVYSVDTARAHARLRATLAVR